MVRFKNLLAVAALMTGILFGVTGAARADDWDHDHWRDRYEQRAYYGDYWRDRDGRCYRRVWDPYRGWIVVRFYPEPHSGDAEAQQHSLVDMLTNQYKPQGGSGHVRYGNCSNGKFRSQLRRERGRQYAADAEASHRGNGAAYNRSY